MARPRSVEPGTRLVIYLPESTYTALQTRLTQPGGKKPPYGAVSKYLATLVQRELARLTPAV
jgi:hypothetical protein